MDLSAATQWWAAAGVLVALELASGSFYLLMLALGAAGAALAAHAGVSVVAQFVVAALVGGGATAVWHFKRARAPRSAPAACAWISTAPWQSRTRTPAGPVVCWGAS